MKQSIKERVWIIRRTRKRMGCALLAGIMFLMLCFLTYFVLNFGYVQRGWVYPFHNREIVEKYSAEYDVDPYLAAAVIKVESGFRKDVHSHRGAVGLMQLMPSTARWISRQIDDAGFDMDKLHEPETNIRYGVWYLSSLEREFEDNDILVLAAYNAGRGNVSDWMELYGWGYDFQDINEIPFGETRAYVHRVLKCKEKYRRLYEEENDE